MPVNRVPSFIPSLVELFDSQRRAFALVPVPLGGSSGPGGGTGTPPGGTIGQLRQSLVAYDTTEAETQIGQASLVDNLNHIRAEIYERAWWGY